MIDGLLEGIVEFAVVALGASTFQNLLLTKWHYTQNLPSFERRLFLHL